MTKTIWCLGMYASASTWLFNITRELYRFSSPGLLETHFLSPDGTPPVLNMSTSTVLIKSHEITNPTTLSHLKFSSDKIIVSLRDPRDAVASLILYHKYRFDRALSHVHDVSKLCVDFFSDPRAIIFCYESRFFEHPNTLPKLAGFLGIDITSSAQDKIFAAFRREEVERYISKMHLEPGILQDPESKDMLDPKTHWHTHHSGRSGEVGKWKHFLTADQENQIKVTLADCIQIK